MTTSRYYSHLVENHSYPPTGTVMMLDRWVFASVKDCRYRWALRPESTDRLPASHPVALKSGIAQYSFEFY